MKFYSKRIDFLMYQLPKALAICLGLFWLIFIYQCGVHLSPDSIKYLGYGMRMHNASNFEVLPNWPPLYPLLINLFLFFVRFPADAAALISGVSMILFLIVFVLIVNYFSKDVILNILVLLSLFTLPGFLYPYSRAWSEVPFSLFLLLNLYFVIMHFGTGKFRYYLLAAAFVSLAALTRYAGYFLIPIFFFYTIFYVVSRRLDKLHAIKYFLLNSITYIPSVLVVLNNFKVSQTLHGLRSPTELTVWQNIGDVFQVLWSDFGFLALILLGVSIALIVAGFRQKNGNNRSEIFLVFVYIITSIILYLSLIVYNPYSYGEENIYTRFLSPIYFGFFILFAIGINTGNQVIFGKHFLEHRYKNLVKIFLYGLLLIVLFVNYFGFSGFIHNITKYRSYPMTYHLSGFNLSPTNKNLNDYFSNEFNSNDDVNVSIITKSKYYSLGALYYRRNVLANLLNTGFSFDQVNLDIWGGGEFKINFQSEGQEKQLHYNYFSQPSDINNLQSSLANYFVENGQPLWLILDQGFHEGFQDTEENLFINNLMIESYKNIQPYHIYKIVEFNNPFVETFEYQDSPLEQGWEIATTDIDGEVQIIYDDDIHSRVIRIQSQAGTEFRIDKYVLNQQRSNLSFKVKANSMFYVYARVKAEDGETYILQYIPGDSDSYSKDTYVIHYLGQEYLDGNWHQVTRDLDQDLYDLTGMHFKRLFEFMVRGGDIWMDEILLE